MGKLSKKEAIRLHREMWNWIADEIEKGQTHDVYYLKRKYIRDIKGMSLRTPHFCFCCEYAIQQYEHYIRYNRTRSRCYYCPLIWGTEDKILRGSYCCNNPFYSYDKDNPRHIANLSEKGRRLI